MKRVLAVCLLLMFLVVGCASNDSKLVGRWEREGDKLTLNEDNTGDLSGNPITWAYTEDHLKLYYENGMEFTFTASFDGDDRMTLVTEGDPVIEAEFTRVED